MDDAVRRWGERGLEIVRALVERDGLNMPRQIFLLATKKPGGEHLSKDEYETVSLCEEGDPVPMAVYMSAVSSAIEAFAARAIVLVFTDPESGGVGYLFLPLNEARDGVPRSWFAEVIEASGVTVCGPFREATVPIDMVSSWGIT